MAAHLTSTRPSIASRLLTLLVIAALHAGASAQAPATAADGLKDRQYWAATLYRIAAPVILNLANGTLKANMPVEVPPGQDDGFFRRVTHLEAVGRTMAGVAPWLALPDDDTAEGQLRRQLRGAFLKGIANGVNPAHPDYLNFRAEKQPIVDAAYLAQAFIRAPKALWEPLDKTTRQRLIDEFKALRSRTGAYNNWLLFAGINEAFLLSIGEQADPVRIEFAKRKMAEWYVGDGWYSDGPKFSMDYYNSYVIHSMLVDFLDVLVAHQMADRAEHQAAVQRLVRYAEFTERLIAPDGSYPAFGRSITYRTGAFQALAHAALMEKLPPHVAPAQVRGALTAVMRRMFDGCANFDDRGWLVLGFCGHQPGVADIYTSTGSLYMATLGFLALGLPADSRFWTDPPTDWTARKAWSGKPLHKDYKVEY